MTNRIVNGASNYQKKIDGLIEKSVDLQGKPIAESLESMDRDMDLTFSEHSSYQDLQARGHAKAKLTTEEAQTIYMALGESMSSKNGGWKPHVNLPMKLIITQVMAELLNIKV